MSKREVRGYGGCAVVQVECVVVAEQRLQSACEFLFYFMYSLLLYRYSKRAMRRVIVEQNL